MIKRLIVCAAALSPQTGFADDAPVLTFLGREGCSVGTGTEGVAVAAGLEPGAVADFVASLDPGDIDQQGAWQVLSERVCAIEFPRIEPVLQHDDPDVRAAWTAPDELVAEFDAPGCYFGVDRLVAAANSARGWTEAETYNAYFEYLAAGIISGDIRFYSDNPLATPWGPRLMIGDCAVGDDVDEINSNHAVLAAAFGPYLRRVAPELICGEDASTTSVWPQPDIEELIGLSNTNAHLFFEVFLVTLGAGWIERDRSDVRDRGTLRPPACEYPD